MTVDFGTFANADVDSAEEVFTLNTQGRTRLWLTFVVGTANLTAFTVGFKVHPSGGYTLVAPAGGMTGPKAPVLFATSDLNTAASGATVHSIVLDVTGVYSVQVNAAGTSSTITGYYSID